MKNRFVVLSVLSLALCSTTDNESNSPTSQTDRPRPPAPTGAAVGMEF